MKRILTAVVTLILSVTTISAQRLANISVEAQYITDKMAVELGLSTIQRASVFQLNVDYLNGITSYRDIDAKIWKLRNKKLKNVLNGSQWKLYKNAYYFYRPIGWKNGAYVHNIYAKYPKKAFKTKDVKYGKRDKNKRREINRHNKRRINERERTFGSRR